MSVGGRWEVASGTACRGVEAVVDAVSKKVGEPGGNMCGGDAGAAILVVHVPRTFRKVVVAGRVELGNVFQISGRVAVAKLVREIANRASGVL